jgi:GNAT superfamily N-acetyltransferase
MIQRDSIRPQSLKPRAQSLTVSSLLIRPATVGDLPQLVRLLRECVAAMQRDGIDQWDDIYPTGEVLGGDIESGTIYVTALDAQRVIGAVVLDEHQAPQYRDVPWTIADGKVGVVHRLMVHPDFQREGIARSLMEFIEIRARELGYTVIRLDTFTRNPRALRLYQRLGYRDAGPVTLRKGLFRCFEKALE